jgi:ribosomal protein L7/L12
MIETRPEVDLRLVELKRIGASPIEAIKTIHGEFGLSLGEAKLRFAQSSAWAAHQAAAENLHQQIFDAFGDEGSE